MITCSSCFRILPPDAFVHNNKIYKTCARCKTNRAKKKNTKQSILVDDANNEETPVEIISIQEIRSFIADTIDGMEHEAELFLTFYVKLDEETLCAVGTDVRVMVKLIVDEIEEGDDYVWM